MNYKEALPLFDVEADTGPLVGKHNQMVKAFGSYALENFGSEIKAIHSEYQIGDLLADVYIERKDGSKEVVEVDTNIDKYTSLKVRTDGFKDEEKKVEWLDREWLMRSPESSTSDGFEFCPRGMDGLELATRLRSLGWDVEPVYEMNNIVEKFYRRADRTALFSLVVRELDTNTLIEECKDVIKAYENEGRYSEAESLEKMLKKESTKLEASVPHEDLNAFLEELKRHGPPVYRVYIYSEFAAKVTGFVELKGENRTCQK